jgi:hypothetical protein
MEMDPRKTENTPYDQESKRSYNNRSNMQNCKVKKTLSLISFFEGIEYLNLKKKKLI